MNRVVSSVLFICIIIGCSLWSLKEIRKRTIHMTDLMEKDRIITQTEEKSSTERTEEIIKEWSENENFFASVLGNNEIQIIEIGIMNLQDYNNESLYDEYIETLNNCINELKHIVETESIHYKNIL